MVLWSGMIREQQRFTCKLVFTRKLGCDEVPKEKYGDSPEKMRCGSLYIIEKYRKERKRGSSKV